MPVEDSLLKLVERAEAEREFLAHELDKLLEESTALSMVAAGLATNSTNDDSLILDTTIVVDAISHIVSCPAVCVPDH
jgi:hypothetical protein